MKCSSISYDELVTHFVPGPRSLSYFNVFFVLLIALCIPPSVLSHRRLCIVFIPIIVASTVHAWIAMGGTDVISMDYGIRSLVLLGLRDPRTFVFLRRREARSGHSSGGEGQAPYDELRYPEKESLPARLSWAARLLANSWLFVNCRIGDPAHDKRQPWRPRAALTGPENRRFIVQSIIRGIVGYLVLDLTSHVIRSDPYFTDLTVPITAHGPRAVSSALLNPLYTSASSALAVRSLLTATALFTLLSQQIHLPLAVLALLTELRLLPASFNPACMPPPFGSPLHTLRHGLRGFWSRTWHQAMRFPAAGAGRLARSAVGPGAMGHAAHTLAAFAASGAVHVGLVPSAPVLASVGAAGLRWRLFAFFAVQGVGVLVEEVGAAVVRGMVPGGVRASRVGRAVAMVGTAGWVVVWAVACFPLVAEATRQLGYYRVHPLPFSAVEWARGGDGWMWECPI